MGVVGSAQSAHHKLDPLDRRICGWLAAMDLWPKTEIAKAFGISTRVVRKHELRYGKEVWSDATPGRTQEP